MTIKITMGWITEKAIFDYVRESKMLVIGNPGRVVHQDTKEFTGLRGIKNGALGFVLTASGYILVTFSMK